jgi:Flp pilus assembly protein CpaB
MPNRTPRRRTITAIAIAVALCLILFVCLEKVQSAPPPQVAVLVATRDIQIAEPITPTMVHVVQVPQEALVGPAPALAGDAALVERSTARAPIFAGEVIDLRRLYGPGLALTSAPDEVFLKKGYALYTVPTAHLALPLSGLAAGDYVEVLATFDHAPPAAVDAGGGTTTLRTTHGGVQPIDAHALVTDVAPDESAVTLAVPKGELPYLAFLRHLGASFSFAQVRPDDPTGPMAGVTARQFRQTYHVPSE